MQSLNIYAGFCHSFASGAKAKGEYNKIHDWHRDDQMRPLTDKGKQQAKAARSWYTKSIGNKSNKVHKGCLV